MVNEISKKAEDSKFQKVKICLDLGPKLGSPTYDFDPQTEEESREGVNFRQRFDKRKIYVAI